jgi:uncharacterized protein YuzE
LETTRYFDEQVMRKRPYLRPEWCERALKHPAHVELQSNGRWRYWVFVEDLGRYLRVVTLEDGVTVHNAFPDRSFPGGAAMRFHYYEETDSLYIDLAERPSTDSREVAPGVVLDVDESGRLVGIDIDQASTVADLTRLVIQAMPLASVELVPSGRENPARS